MNKVLLIGRLTKNPEIKYVGSAQSAVVEFILAVDRKHKSKDGSKKTDFINIEAWDKKAELCHKYLRKGSLVSVDGRIIVDNYKGSDGRSRSVTKIRLYDVNFLESKNKNQEDISKKIIFEGKELFKQDEICVDIAEEDIPF